MEHLLLQLGQVGDDHHDEQVDHGDRAQDDEEEEKEHCKPATDDVSSERLVEISKVELTQSHRQCGHDALPGTLENVAFESEVDDHEGKGEATNHQAHGNDISEGLPGTECLSLLNFKVFLASPDDVVIHDAEVASPKWIATDDEDELHPSSANADGSDPSNQGRVLHGDVHQDVLRHDRNTWKEQRQLQFLGLYFLNHTCRQDHHPFNQVLQLLEILKPEHGCLIELENGEKAKENEKEDFCDEEHTVRLPGAQNACFLLRQVFIIRLHSHCHFFFFALAAVTTAWEGKV